MGNPTILGERDHGGKTVLDNVNRDLMGPNIIIYMPAHAALESPEISRAVVNVENSILAVDSEGQDETQEHIESGTVENIITHVGPIIQDIPNLSPILSGMILQLPTLPSGLVENQNIMGQESKHLPIDILSESLPNSTGPSFSESGPPGKVPLNLSLGFSEQNDSPHVRVSSKLTHKSRSEPK